MVTRYSAKHDALRIASYVLPAVVFVSYALLTPSPVLARGNPDAMSTPGTSAPSLMQKFIDESSSSQRSDPANASPTIGGASGLIRLVTGDIGERHTFRIALHGELFSGADFLVRGDDNTRFIGTLAASYTPWRYLELFFNLRSQSNLNERDQLLERQDSEAIFALGDLGLGAKVRYPLHPAIVVGGNVGLMLLNSMGGISVDGDATGFYGGVLSSIDLGALARFNLPLRFHTNVGFFLDNSANLKDYVSICAGGATSSGCYGIESLNVEKFALGMNRPRLQLKFGLDAQLRSLTKIGLMPLAELGVDIATGDADSDFARFVGTDLQPKDFDGRTTAWLTLGVRVNPVRGLALDVATDVGLLSPGYGYGPPVMPWNVILGLSYAYDPNPVTGLVTRVTAVSQGRAMGPAMGRVSGRVTDALSAMPLEGAVVTFPGKDLTGLSSDPDGGFLSYDFPPGDLTIAVRHRDYQPARKVIHIVAGTLTRVEVPLQPAAPRTGELHGTVLSGRDNKGVVAAHLSFSGAEAKTLETDAQGRYRVQLKPGDYTVRVSSDNEGSTTASLQVAAGESTERSFILLEKHAELDPSLIKVTKRQIILRRRIHFASGKADLLPDAAQLLDLVVNALRINSQLRVLIQGHTDNVGRPSFNRRLSQRRAEAVRDYLLQQDISAERLAAKGYGSDRPKLSNLTVQGRMANRRVEFHIMK